MVEIEVISHFGVVDLGVDSTLSFSFSLLHPDEPIGSPAGTPRVTDDPVRSGGISVVADESDSMVARGGAVVGQDSAGVGLEGVTGGVDGDSDGTLVDSRGHGGDVSSDVLVAGGVDLTLACGVLAGTVDSSVGVGGFFFSSGTLEVGEDLVSPSTITSVAAGVAINVLLGSKSQKSARFDAVCGLNNGGTGE